eukprot:210745_1
MIHLNIDKSVYDPDHLTEQQIRNQFLYNNYLSSLYFPTHTQIGSGLFGAISCLQLLSTRTQVQSTTSKYLYVLMFFVANFCLQCIGQMIGLWKHGHLTNLEFTDSVFTSVLLGSAYKCATLSVVFLDRYTYGVYLFHGFPIVVFTMNEEYRKAVHSQDGVDASEVMNIFGKSYVIALVISMIVSHTIEYPFAVFRKTKVASGLKKK